MLQCNEFKWGHPTFFCQSQGEFRTKESGCGFFRTNHSTGKFERESMRRAKRMCTSALIFIAKWCLFQSTASQANGNGNKSWQIKDRGKVNKYNYCVQYLSLQPKAGTYLEFCKTGSYLPSVPIKWELSQFLSFKT